MDQLLAQGLESPEGHEMERAGWKTRQRSKSTLIVDRNKLESSDIANAHLRDVSKRQIVGPLTVRDVEVSSCLHYMSLTTSWSNRVFHCKSGRQMVDVRMKNSTMSAMSTRVDKRNSVRLAVTQSHPENKEAQ